MSVLLETSVGEIVIDLEVDKAPLASLNFLKLCKAKFYNFSLFHSIQPGFGAQTGRPAAPSPGLEEGQSVWGLASGPEKRYFAPELHPKLRHDGRGIVSFATAATTEAGTPMAGSQFFITLADKALDYLDGKMAVFGRVAEGLETLDKLSAAIVDEDNIPYKDIRIMHTIILDDPFDDPPGLVIPDRSPVLTDEILKDGRIGADDEEGNGISPEELEKMTRQREAEARALTLEMVGDLPFAEIKPPENVLFVCKLNPVTRDEDLELIFSRFGKIASCEILRDKKTGDSLCYAFVEFDDKDACEEAYFKMNNVLIDDRRIHVDFSQSVTNLHQQFLHSKRGDGFGGADNLMRKTRYRDDGEPGERESYDLVFEHQGDLKREKSRDTGPRKEHYSPRESGTSRSNKEDRGRDVDRKREDTRHRPYSRERSDLRDSRPDSRREYDRHFSSKDRPKHYERRR